MKTKEQIAGAMFTEFDLSDSQNGWHRFTNPLDLKSLSKGDKTMTFNPSLSWVKCFRTGYTAPAITFLSDYWSLPKSGVFDSLKHYKPVKVEEKPFKVNASKEITGIPHPENFKRLSYGNGLLANRARKYLFDRSFDIDYLDNKGFGYFDSGEFIGHIFIPYFVNGMLVYYSLRNFIGGTPRYYNLPNKTFDIGKSEILFNQDALNIFDSVYIVEGAFDALTMGYNGSSLSGWNISTIQLEYMLKSPCKRFIFIPDKGFYSQTIKEAAKLLFKKEVFVIDTRIFEVGDDVNDWGKESIKELEKLCKPLEISQLWSETQH